MAIPIDKLPKNIDAEKATLGAMLSSTAAKEEALSSLEIKDFFVPIHQTIFTAIFNLYTRNIKVDIQTVAQELTNMKSLNEVGGVEYLYELTQSMLTLENVEEYIDIVKDNANLRNLLITMRDIEEDYLKRDITSYTSFVGEAQQKINKIAEQRRISNFATSEAIVNEVTSRIFEMNETYKENELTGVNTGFRLLNYYTNGFQKQNLIVVAGRTGCGKTAFALNLALNAAKEDKIPVAIFEMEMSAASLYCRLLANLSNVEGRKIINGRFDKKESVKILNAANQLKELKIFVDESAHLTIYDLVAKAHKLKTEQPDLGLIVIDYIGLIANDNKGKNRKFDNRQLEIQEYTRTIHELARELDLPIVLLCQLNRNNELRNKSNGNDIPRLSDLRESGSIEHDAELVLLLHRDDYGKNDLNKNKEKVAAANMSPEARQTLLQKAEERTIKENAETKDKNTSIMQVIIAKNRNGQADCHFPLIFEKNYGRFENTSREFNDRHEEIVQKYYEEE